jgi:PrtD family type I secretion system ABC transporter
VVSVAQVAEGEVDATALAAARLRERLGRMKSAEQRRAERRAGSTATPEPVAQEPASELPAVAAARAPVEEIQRPEPEPVGKAVAARPARPVTTPPSIARETITAARVADPVAIPQPDELTGKGELRRALEASKRALKAVGWFSCGINILMLTGPIFMLQVYDRVMASGSYWTLTVLLLITTVLYGVIGALEYIRTRVITRIGVEIDQRVGDRVFEASMRKSLGGPGQATGALRELDTLRNFVAGPAPMTAFDLAWTPIYLLVIFLTHWTLGIASALGMAALLFCAWLSDAQGKAPLAEASKAAAKGIDLAETGARNADSITAMGMMGAYRARWQHTNQQALGWQVLASDRLGGTAAVSKTLRLLMQSIMLAIGAALAMRGDISAGAIIAGTIIFGRALAPVEQVITHWKSSAKALESYNKLEALLAAVPPRPNRTALPRPSGRVVIEGLRVAAPETKTLILAGISCETVPGKLLAVIGPSASGKSTFIRALVGLWPAFAGSIKLDDVKLDQWHSEDLGRHIGYLPQDVELFGGTVRDNISRFRADASDGDVITAAKAAHAHELIMGLPKGYETELGAFGAYLSAGQRQRIGLARALFGTPALVVLDEPNANLDRAGDEALAAAIDGMRARGQAIVMVSHRVQAIGKADLLLYIERGVQRAFGPRDDVMRLLNGEQAKPATQAPKAAAPQPSKAQLAPAPAAKVPPAPSKVTAAGKG